MIPLGVQEMQTNGIATSLCGQHRYHMREAALNIALIPSPIEATRTWRTWVGDQIFFIFYLNGDGEATTKTLQPDTA